MTPILSILTPTMEKRYTMFDFISDKVKDQIMVMEKLHPTLGVIEFLYHDGQSYLEGGPSIGRKRQELIEMSNGKYLCFLDDDEDIAPNYVETLVRLCQSCADVVTFRSFCKTDFYWSVIDMRLGNENEEATPDRIVKRNAWHICPVKSEYAKLYPFPDSNYGEDWKWMEKVLGHCKTEAHTDQIIHCYNHSSIHSEADKITKHEASNNI
jgi:glycosyltransferase involved in cell wall biosynthesis